MECTVEKLEFENNFLRVPVPKLGSPSEKTRYDTSLGLLTKKFVGLLQSATDGVSNNCILSSY
jgi:hypothetical protein